MPLNKESEARPKRKKIRGTSITVISVCGMIKLQF